MAWKELQLVVTRGDVDAVSARLFSLGASGVQDDYLAGQAPPPRQPWDRGAPPPEPRLKLLRAWFEDPDRSLDALITPLSADGAARWEDVVEQDWEASFQAGFAPIVVSDRLVVAPPWDAPPGALLIDPGQGFGSGQHATTRQCLVALDALVDDATFVLDLGCGSGVLALAALKLGCQARGVDNDPASIRDATAQAALNNLPNVFDDTPIAELAEPADLVLANLFAEALVALAPELIRLTSHTLVLAGILADKEDWVTAVLEPALVPVHREQEGEWVSLRYQVPR